MDDFVIDKKAVYIPSEDVVARAIEDEFLLVPIALGIGNMEDELYSLNETGRVIWERMEHGKTIETLASELAEDYDAPLSEIIDDVEGIITELVKLNMVNKVE